MKKIVSLLLAAALTASMFVGCDSGQTAGSGTGAQDRNITWGVQGPVSSMDPHYISANQDIQFRALVYEPLVFNKTISENPDGSTVTEIQHRLAESHALSDDGTVYTFNLRRGVKFHNGAEFKANDVVFSLDRAAESPFMLSHIDGIVSVEATDDYTVVITLETPRPAFILQLTNIYIMNEAFTLEAGDDIVDKAMGTGPFYLTENAQGQRLDFNAFPDYYRGEAEAKTLTMRSIPDFSTMLMAFEAGELSYVGVPPADVGHIRDSGKYLILSTPTAQIFYVIMNNENAPFDDVRVRQAINYATNRRAHVIIARDGEAYEAFTMVNPAMVLEAFMPDNLYEHNAEKAKELLAEAGFPNGFTIDSRIKVPSGIGMESSAQVLQEDLAAIGVTASIDVVEINSYIADLFMGNFDIGVMAITLPSHMTFFSQIFHSSFIDNLNMARYSNPRVDELFDIASVTVNTDERLGMYKEIINIVNQDAAYVPLNFGINNWALQPGLNLRYPAHSMEVYDFYWE